MSLEQKKFFESGVAAERARILDELDKNIFDREHVVDYGVWPEEFGAHKHYAYRSLRDIFEIVKGETPACNKTRTTL